MKQNQHKKIICLCLTVFLCSCSLTDSYNYPYALGAIEFLLEKNEQEHTRSILTIEFLNTSNKKIQSMLVQFYVYDGLTGKNPFKGTNRIKVECKLDIEPRTFKKIEMCLDQYLSIIPKNPFLIDNFTIRSIVYEDASTWKNPEFFLEFL